VVLAMDSMSHVEVDGIEIGYRFGGIRIALPVCNGIL